jgi:hypothetical protein
VNRDQVTGGHKGIASGHDIIMADMISSSSRGQIGRVADNTISQKVAASVQNLAGLSNGIQSPCIIAVIPTSMNHDRQPYLKYHQPHNLMEVVARQNPERRKLTTMLELMELEKTTTLGGLLNIGRSCLVLCRNIGLTFDHWVVPSCPLMVPYGDTHFRYQHM